MSNMRFSRTEIAMAISMVVFTACTTDTSNVANDGDELGIKQSSVISVNPYEWDTAVALPLIAVSSQNVIGSFEARFFYAQGTTSA